MTAVRYEEAEGIVTLTFCRPEVKNAINDAVMVELGDAVTRLEERSDLVAVILTGQGDESFCSGGDLKWLKEFGSPERGQEMSRRMQKILGRLSGLPVPIIGALNGYAFGGGAEISLACDMRVFEEHAFLCFKQAQMGIMTGWGGGARLLQLVGYGRAIELLTTCRKVLATEALELGLANAVAPKGEGLSKALELANRVRRAAPGGVAAAKVLLRTSANLEIDDAAEVETELFGTVWHSADHNEALAAFFEKRRPKFR